MPADVIAAEHVPRRVPAAPRQQEPTVWSLLRGALPKRRWFYLAALLLLALLGIILWEATPPQKPQPLQTQTVPITTWDGQNVTPPQPKRVLTNSIGMRLVRIEPGSFQMGTTKEQIDQLLRLFPDSKRELFDAEQPQHPVKITRPFFLGIHEVTAGQFRRFVEESGHQTEAEKDGKGSHVWNETKKTWELDPGKNWRNPGFSQTDDHPVVCVSHNDAMAFCQWLSQKERLTYRLPTEAEWEFACRAGTGTLYPLGDDPESLVTIANVADASLKRKFPNFTCIDGDDRFVYTAPVGSFAPNPWGLYDMIGNVWEWCADWYDGRYYSSSSPDDPPGAPRPRTGLSGAVAGASTPGTAARRTASGSRRGTGATTWASAWPQSRNKLGTEPSRGGWSAS